MKINWRVRFTNPQFLFQLFISIAVPIGAYFGITGADVTTWPGLFGIILDAISNPFVLFMIATSVYNSLNDPTNVGLSDSPDALRYAKPRKGDIIVKKD